MDLQRYTPEFVNRRFASEHEPPSAFEEEEALCAVLWCDIVNFTGLTERLVAAGPVGVESLTGYLNAYYSRLVGLVHGHGGDVIEFAGDALLAVWRVDASSSEADQVVRAGTCALDIQAELHNYRVSDQIKLSQRVAVGVGPMRFSWVGGILSRWTIVASGEPLAQTQAIDHDVEPGQVVVSARGWELAHTRCQGRLLPGGSTRLLSIRSGPRRAALKRIEPPAEAEPALRVFLPGAVLARVKAGQGRWLAELRNISVLFIQMTDLAPEDEKALAVVHEVMVQCQHAVYRQGGAVSKVSMADKGTTILGSFGLPPLAHEDDPVRAVEAAMDIVSRLDGIGVRASVGVTTGQVFCGLLGGDARCEYTTLGRPVNVASRLMTLVDQGVMVDEPTWRASQRRLGYDALAPVQVKGVPDPVAVYRPTGESRTEVRPPTQIVGRQDELDILSEQLQTVLRQGDAGVVVLEGEAGIGKSRIVLEAIQKAHELAVHPVLLAAQAIEKDTIYFAWREALGHILGVDTDDDGGLMDRLEEAVSSDPELVRLVPLLGAILSTNLDDNDHTGEMDGLVRAANTRAFVTRLVQRLAETQPLLLIVEDAHWLDSSSWALLVEVVATVRPLAVLIATRPFEETPAEFDRLREGEHFRHVVLDHLSPENTIQLVCQRLGVVALPDEVGEALVEKAGGNPFFSEELAYSLRDSGHLLIQDGTCGLAPGKNMEELALPTTVQGAVVSRVDRLSPSSQLVLKVASVIGREFLQRILEDVYPSAETGDEVAALLPPLVTQDMILPEVTGDDPAYIFKHALGQQAVYELMPFAQRREWHAKVAEYYEDQGERRDALYAVLAYHWSQAQESVKAFSYLCKAAEQALSRHACREAVRFYRRALALRDEEPTLATAHEVAVLQEGLARALYGTGDSAACRVHSRRALALFGHPVAKDGTRLAFGFIGQVVRAWLQARWPKSYEVHTDLERQAALLSSRMQSTLAEIAMFRDETLRLLYAAMRQLIAARSLGPSAELARAYALMANMLAVIPMRKTCNAWCDRSLEMVEEHGTRLDKAWVYCRAACYKAFVVDWAAMDRLIPEGAAIAEEIGDRRLYEEAIVSLGVLGLARGRYESAEQALLRTIQSSLASGNAQSNTWAKLHLAEGYHRMGRLPEALELCEESRSYVDSDAAMSSERVMGLAIHGLVRYRSGEVEEGLKDAEEVYEKFLKGKPLGYWTIHVAHEAAEVFAAELERGAGDRKALLQRLRQAIKMMFAMGKLYLYCQPVALNWRGRLQLLEGKQDKAIASWREAAELAEATGCDREQGVARALLGKHLPEGKERTRMGKDGRALLKKNGALGDLAALK
jgi:class 3 adenylate cyclase/tetratricopeptide (TPR) repeat protein